MNININRYSSNIPLRRLGTKNIIAPILAKYVPGDFDMLISLFFGTGSFEYNFIGKIKYLFANDLDSNVFNLFQVLTDKSKELLNRIKMLPIGFDSWEYYKNLEPNNDIEKAVKFLYLSNFGYLGKPDTLKNSFDNSKSKLLDDIKNFYSEIVNNNITTIKYLNNNYLDVLKKISFKSQVEINRSFIFADPPYIETANNYDTPLWTYENHKELQTYLINSGIKFMICEFDNPQIIELSKKNNLFITKIKERINLKNRRTEIIITNYKPVIIEQQKLF